IDSAHLIKVTLHISNTGNRSAYINLEPSQDGRTEETVLKVSKLSLSSDAESRAGVQTEPVGSHYIGAGSMECHPGQTLVNIPVPLRNRGVYKFTLKTVVNKRDLVPEISKSIAESAIYTVEDVFVVPPVASQSKTKRGSGKV